MIFARTAASEIQHKNMLGASASRAQKLILAQELILKTKELGRHSGLDVVVCNDFHQRGETFAKRLSNAFQETFYKGYEQVVAIGSDTPALSVSHINSAVQSLQQQNVVLGPSTDGGVYLIGMHRSTFSQSSFENLPWLSSSVYNAFVDEMTNQGQSLLSLETLSDIDDLQGLFAAINELSSMDSFQNLALQFLFGHGNLPITNYPLPPLYDGLPATMRAPPFFY